MLQNIRRADEKFYKNSLRIGEYGAFELYKEQTNDPNGIITPDTRDEAWYRSQGRVMQMTVLDPNTNITISNARSCVITDAENTSKQVTVTFVYVGFGFTMVPTLYHNNQIGYEQDFRTKYRTGEDAMGNAIDQLCVANLALGQSQPFSMTIPQPSTIAPADSTILIKPWSAQPLARKSSMIRTCSPSCRNFLETMT